MTEATKIPSIGQRKVHDTKFGPFKLYFETFGKPKFDNEVFKVTIKEGFKKQVQLVSVV